MPRLIDADKLMESVRKALGIKRMAKSFLLPAKRTIIDQIDSAPTIGKWISVKERLPEEHADEHPYEFEQFLCSTVWDDVRMVGFGTRIGDDKQHFWSGNSIWDDWVTHWMPLPSVEGLDET